jgi:hypothetical protein
MTSLEDIGEIIGGLVSSKKQIELKMNEEQKEEIINEIIETRRQVLLHWRVAILVMAFAGIVGFII